MCYEVLKNLLKVEIYLKHIYIEKNLKQILMNLNIKLTKHQFFLSPS